MSLLIAEIGNNHMGSMKLAKELIRVANESGADLIKGQAYRAEDIKTGSMSPDFYRHCQFSEDQNLELIAYARSLHTDMFFSIFSSGFERLKAAQKWTKLAASQTKSGLYQPELDTAWSVVSFPKAMIDDRRVPRMRHAWPLYASEYMPRYPQLEYLEKLRDQVMGPVGLSDHHVGYDVCLKAIRWHNVNCIEKHFTLQKEMSWGGQIFRDTIHGATPQQLEIIANAMH